MPPNAPTPPAPRLWRARRAIPKREEGDKPLSRFRGLRSVPEAGVGGEVLFLFLSLLGIFTLLLSTRYGPGVGGDATIYITSARNLLDGVGLGLIEPTGQFRLLPYFAPFFPIGLSILGLFTSNLVAAAQWLNILLFGGLIFLAGWFTSKLFGSLLWAGLAGLLVLVSPILIPIYSWAMSEPLSLFLGFLGLWLLLLALRRDRPGLVFYFSALSTGLSFLTRYSCIAFVGAAALGWWIFRKSGRLRRTGESLLYILVGILPMLPWLVINLSHTTTVSSRSLESFSNMAARLAAFWPQLSEVILSWLVPFSWIDTPPYPALINRVLPPALILFTLVVLIVVVSRARRSLASLADDRPRWIWLLVLLSVIYAAVILVVYVTTYPPITIDNRMLSPLHVALLWLLLSLAALTPELWSSRWLRALLPLALLLFVAWSGWRSARIVQQNYYTGLGYTSPAWRQSETIQAVRALPVDRPIVTNEVTAVLFLTGRRAYTFMEIYRDQPLPSFTRYGQGDLSDDPGQRLFRQGAAELVLFDTLAQQFESIYGAQTAARITALTGGLTPLFKGSDGNIYTNGEQ